MTIYDAEHYTDEEKEAIISGFPKHERDARAKGVPQLGSGRIFPLSDEEIEEPAIEMPEYWPRICGKDFGWDHPAACVWMAWDRDSDVVHVYDCYKKSETLISTHASMMKKRGKWIPVAWPHDGYQHDKGSSGKEVRRLYEEEGVNMLPEHATFVDGGYGLEAGIADMLERMKSGRLKVAKHLHDWFEEFRLYHRVDGKVVKEYDDLMAATRYGIMMLRLAAVEPDDDDDYDERSGRSETGGY